MMLEQYGFHDKVPPGVPCVVCGEDAAGSLYWTPTDDKNWAVIRKFLADFFPAGMVQNMLFNADYNKAYCSGLCVTQRSI